MNLTKQFISIKVKILWILNERIVFPLPHVFCMLFLKSCCILSNANRFEIFKNEKRSKNIEEILTLNYLRFLFTQPT